MQLHELILVKAYLMLGFVTNWSKPAAQLTPSTGMPATLVALGSQI